MSLAEDRRKALRRYVLGTSPEIEQEALDGELAQDGGLLDELEVAEVDLLDAYACGELPAAERGQVEEIYLATPSGRRRLAFARALQRRATEGKASRRAVPRWAALAAVWAVVAVGGVALVWQNLSLRGDIGRLRTMQEELAVRGKTLAREAVENQAEIAQLRAELESVVRESPLGALPAAAVTIVRMVLRPGLVRDAEGAPTLVLAEKITWVELELMSAADGYQSYTVSLETPEGESLWRSNPIVPPALERGRGLVVRLPAATFKGGTLIVILSGRTSSGSEEQVADYTLRVLRRG